MPSYLIRYFYFRLVLRNNCSNSAALHRNIKLFVCGGISIGDQTTINRGVTLDGRGVLKIGNSVSISEGVKLLTASHDLDSFDFKQILKPVVIEDYVWIGVNSIVLPGVTLHKGAVVGAGSVVTRDVSPYTVVAGNPAKFIRNRRVIPSYTALWKPYLF
jgi:maltose O-acetyltransferase